jgi:predicted Zn-dependent peptidase
MLARIQGLFGGWKRSGEPPPPLPAAKPVPRPGTYVVDRDLNQSNLAIGHWGTDRSNPDRFAIHLMNAVLGGGSFSSRITERVRSDEGLAYSARSQYATSDREVGLFLATAQTRTETTVKAIRSIVEEIGKMRASGISENEFRTAKESLLHSYLFRFEDPVENVIRLLRLEIDGLPADYYETEFRGYQAVERADLERAAAKYLRPKDLTLFVVGKLSAFRSDLSALGEVHPIALQEFSIPEGRKK